MADKFEISSAVQHSADAKQSFTRIVGTITARLVLATIGLSRFQIERTIWPAALPGTAADLAGGWFIDADLTFYLGNAVTAYLPLKTGYNYAALNPPATNDFLFGAGFNTSPNLNSFFGGGGGPGQMMLTHKLLSDGPVFLSPYKVRCQADRAEIVVNRISSTQAIIGAAILSEYPA